jgi:phospholipid transport system substrate-binding protein
MFIGTAFSATICPALSIDENYASPATQAEVVINNTICALMQLKKDGIYTHLNVLNISKKQIIPFIDVEYITELALAEYWARLKPDERKTFEKNLTKSIIENYLSLLSSFDQFENISIEVDKNIITNDDKSEIKIHIYIGTFRGSTTINLKMIRKNNQWRVYDLIFQAFSILEIEKMGYRSRIKRFGLHNFLKRIQ